MTDSASPPHHEYDNKMIQISIHPAVPAEALAKAGRSTIVSLEGRVLALKNNRRSNRLLVLFILISPKGYHETNAFYDRIDICAFYYS